MADKQETYASVLKSIDALIKDEDDLISVMSTVSCELYHAFDYFNWVGFYRRVDPQTLKVGPYQGGHGCLTIDLARGVCGKCVRDAAVQLENDVCSLPYHIACSSDTKAEIVLPLFDQGGEVQAVLDIDSIKAHVFDETDADFLGRISKMVSQRFPDEAK